MTYNIKATTSDHHLQMIMRHTCILKTKHPKKKRADNKMQKILDEMKSSTEKQ